MNTSSSHVFRGSTRRFWFWLAVLIFVTSLQTIQAQETNEVGQEEKTKKKTFNFDGGNPLEFIVALDKHFRTRLVQILTLPETLSRTKVPKLRVAAEDPREVLNLYNRLESPTLGRWKYEPPQNVATTNMNVLMLVPDKNSAVPKVEQATKVKGIALAGVPEPKWDSLLRDIAEARASGEDATRGADDSFRGTTRVQRDSKVLIVVGSDTYLQMVESLVSAHRMNAEIEAKAVSKVSDTVPR